jgi:phosphoribosylaminoimidazolecarboxamide formyltransferase / IMP cyclohydrolase
MNLQINPIKRALLSVSDKSGLKELATCLHEFGVELIASGGTAIFIREMGLPVTAAESLTGNPEAFGGRMKTLSFQILSSLLYRRDHQQDCAEAQELGIEAIDLVVCHLYPFAKVVAAKGGLEDLIENIDIGGPSMLRAAAKNYQSVLVCPEPSFYPQLIEHLNTNKGASSLEFRRMMMLHTFRHTAHYDSLITNTLEERFEDENHSVFLSSAYGEKLRYGENPQQQAFVCPTRGGFSLSNSTPLQGKELSYNNLWDADQAFRAARDLHALFAHENLCGAVVVKHANACGLALAADSAGALELAWQGDSVSAFGSILAFTHSFTLTQAQWLHDKFVEVIIAPDFTSQALELLSKKKNLRVLKISLTEPKREWVYRSIDGGALLQFEDPAPRESWSWLGNAEHQSSDHCVRFGLVAVKHLRSNGIALVRESESNFQLIGAGMGNPNRLVSIEQAVEKARENGVDDFSKVTLVSDAFFPFADNIQQAAVHGIRCFVQPGGSMRDQEVQEALTKINGAMALTQTRHFRH